MRDPLSFKSFVEWLGTKPPKESYPWTMPNICATGQWLRSLGWPEDEIGDKSCRLTNYELFRKAALAYPHEFGAAYERGKVLLGKGPTK